MLRTIRNVEAVEVKSQKALASVAGLILPGGESTTMAKCSASLAFLDLCSKKSDKAFPSGAPVPA